MSVYLGGVDHYQAITYARMKDVIAKFLTEKSSRNATALSALLVTAVSVGGPWSG